MLSSSSRIAVVAPGHIFNEDRLRAGLDLIREAGFQAEPLPDLLRPHRYFAAPDEHRAAHLVEALTSEDWDAVWMARGGSGMTRLLARLDQTRLRADRPVLGFSDASALFCAMHARGAGPLLHAPVVHSLANTEPADREALWALLRGEPATPLYGEPWAAGTADGWLCGGNLAVIAAVCGTPWQLDARGAILVLEDVGEAPFRIDRMLQQLASSGVFDGVAGVAVGILDGCNPPAGATWTLKEIFLEHLGPLGIPVLGEVPVGHGTRNRPFPWHATAHIEGSTLSWTAAGPLSAAIT